MLSCIFRFICISSHPWILITSGSCVLACAFASSHPQTFGSFVLVDICTSLHPHILRLVCACWHPCILTSLYPEVHVCLLASLHHILIYSASYVFGCILTYSHPYVILPDFYVFFFVSSHPPILILRFMSACWYPFILISSVSCVFPFYPLTLSSSYAQIRVCLFVSLLPHILRPFGSFDPLCWLISSHIIMALYPNILTSSHSQYCVYGCWHSRISHLRTLRLIYFSVFTCIFAPSIGV